MSLKRRNRRLSNADIALAMELREAGVYWYHIAEGLGVDPSSIRRAVSVAKEHGMKESPVIKNPNIYIDPRVTAIYFERKNS